MTDPEAGRTDQDLETRKEEADISQKEEEWKKITVDLVLRARAKMAEERVNGPDDSIGDGNDQATSPRKRFTRLEGSLSPIYGSRRGAVLSEDH